MPPIFRRRLPSLSIALLLLTLCPLSATDAPARRASIQAIANAASYDAVAIAPGEIVVLFGEGVGPHEPLSATIGPGGHLATEVGGTRALFDGVPAPLIYVSRNQTSCVVPYSAGTMRSVMVAVERDGIVGEAFQAQVTQAVPGVFTNDASGRGQAAALNQDSSRNGSDNPAMSGSVVVLYLTGEGETDPPGVDGKPGATPLPEPVQEVTAEIGGQRATIEYAGGAPGLVAGLMQVNLTIPAGVEPGSAVPVRVRAGQRWCQDGVTIAVASGPDNADATMYPVSFDFDRLSGAPDFSFLNEPIIEASRVFVKDSHFHKVGPDLEPHTADDERIRFFGANLSFGGNFPLPEDAPRIARRLRRLGVNLVRLHHMDSASSWSQPSDAESIVTRERFPTLNPLAVSRLRGFLDALKQEGLYANLNLHVGFEFRPVADGVPELPGREMPSQSKPLHIIHWKMIDLQKEYARKLIRALVLGDDPVLSMVEISNEASLVRSWQSGQLDEVLLGEYRSTLEERWNQFLLTKYGATDALRNAWGGGGEPGPELLLGAWLNEQHAPGQATLTTTTTDEVPTARVEVRQGGNWINIKKVGFSVDPSETYQAAVEVRADLPAGHSCSVNWGIKENVEPWRTQVQRNIQISNSWRTYGMVLRPPFAMQFIGRFFLDVQNCSGTTVYIRRESLRTASVGLLEQESLEAANVGLVDGSRAASDAQTADYVLFLAEQDRAYLGVLKDVVREEVGGLVPIAGTQVNWGGGPMTFDSHRELDYRDAHFYEDHYSFPGDAWDSRDWRIRNSSFTSNLDGVRNTAILRERGRPLTVSEFNQPWPNTHAAEIVPVLAANAAFQDWDGLFHYSYSHAHDWDTGLPRTFDLIFDSTKLPVVGQSAWLFRTGAVAAGAQPLEIPITRQQRIAAASSGQIWAWASLFEQQLGIESDVVFRRQVCMVPGEDGVMPEEATQPPARPIVSDTGETTYDPDRGIYLAHSPMAVVIAGSIGHERISAGLVALQLTERSRGFATLVVTPVDSRPLAETRRWLVSIPGYTLSTKPGSDPPEPQRLVNYQGQADWWTLEPDQPGKPSGLNSGLALPMWMERVESLLEIETDAESIRVYPLDGAGQRQAALPASNVEQTENGFRIHLQAAGQTFSPWYEVVGQ